MNLKESEMAIPHLFRCPISLDLFKDPVTLCTGQTYDRPSIERWLAAGNLTCPVTMQRLDDPSIIVPNHALRHLIDRWLELGRRFDPVPESVDLDQSLVSLKTDLESHEATWTVKLRALERVRVLCVESPSKTGAVVQSGFVPLLLRLIFGRIVQPDLPRERVDFLEHAFECVLNLLDHAGVEDLIVLEEDSMLQSLSSLLEYGSSAVKVNICRLVEKLSSSLGAKGLCARLGGNRGFLNSMVSLLRQHSEVSDAAIEAIQSLCCLQLTAENLVEEGTMEGLIHYVSTTKKTGRARFVLPLALTVIQRLLLGVDKAKEAILDDQDGIRILVEMVFRVSGHETSESAVGSLTILCRDSLVAREKAISAGVLTQLLLLIQSQCSGKIKTKARMLLKMLRS